MADVFGADKAPVVTEVDPNAKRLQDKDDFIAKLQGELSGMREELNKKVDLERQLEEIRNELKVQRDATNQPRVDTRPALTEVDIEALVERKLTATEANKSATQNITEANRVVIEKFGDKAAEVVQQKAAELKVSVDFLKSVAAKSPTAFLSVMGIEASQATQQSFKSSVQTGAKDIVPQAGAQREGSKEYFDAIRKADPQKYWTPEIQQQIMKAAKEGKYVTKAA